MSIQSGFYKLVDQSLVHGENPSDGFLYVQNVTLDSGGAVTTDIGLKSGANVSAILLKQYTTTSSGIAIDVDVQAPSASTDATLLVFAKPSDLKTFGPTTPPANLLTTQP